MAAVRDPGAKAVQGGDPSFGRRLENSQLSSLVFGEVHKGADKK